MKLFDCLSSKPSKRPSGAGAKPPLPAPPKKCTTEEFLDSFEQGKLTESMTQIYLDGAQQPQLPAAGKSHHFMYVLSLARQRDPAANAVALAQACEVDGEAIERSFADQEQATKDVAELRQDLERLQHEIVDLKDGNEELADEVAELQQKKIELEEESKRHVEKIAGLKKRITDSNHEAVKSGSFLLSSRICADVSGKGKSANKQNKRATLSGPPTGYVRPGDNLPETMTLHFSTSEEKVYAHHSSIELPGEQSNLLLAETSSH